MPPLKVTITSRCLTVPRDPKLTIGKNDEIQWHTAANSTFDLHLPGGAFKDHPTAFVQRITGPQFQPEPPLIAVAPMTITNYVYDTNGINCTPARPGDAADPPEILIGT